MTCLPTLRRGARQHGFSYVEVLLSVILLAVLLVPALQALQSGIRDGATPSMAARPPLLRAKMEEVLSNPFPELYAETYVGGGNTTGINATFSDAVGATDRRVVVLYRYDVSTRALSAGDTGLLYVSVYYAAESTANALNTLAGRWW
jgi:Tfp pilus assembly protein PilV